MEYAHVKYPRWHHWLDGQECEQTPGVGDGQGSLGCYSPCGHKESDTTKLLNWTELRVPKRQRRNRVISTTAVHLPEGIAQIPAGLADFLFVLAHPPAGREAQACSAHSHRSVSCQRLMEGLQPQLESRKDFRGKALEGRSEAPSVPWCSLGMGRSLGVSGGPGTVTKPWE